MDALWWMCIGAATVVFGGLYAFQELTRPRVTSAAARSPRGNASPEQTSPAVMNPTLQPTETSNGIALRESVTSLSPRQRQHTLIAGSTGDGKSTTLYALLVNDIAHGAQCVVCSTHYTPFHHEDQQIDLRPLAGHFEAYWEHATIAAALHRAGTIIDERMQRYRTNQDVGHDIVLYIGEWGSIERVLGKKEAANLLIQIIDEGRKTRVWIGAIELHSLLVSRFGSDSAFREAFRTRLAGNVDDVTWKAVVGRDIPKQKVAVGRWMTDSGITAVDRPVYRTILDLAEITPHSYKRLVESAALLLTHLLEDAPSHVKPLGSADQLVSTAGINEESTNLPVIPPDTTSRDTSITDEILRAAIWKWLTVDGLSGNAIYQKIGGNRNAVLALVRDIRADQQNSAT